MDINNAKLRELAEAATPGPWRAGQEGNLRVYGPDGEGERAGLLFALGKDQGRVFKGRCNVDYIAAANPATVLALLDEVERLREALEGARR